MNCIPEDKILHQQHAQTITLQQSQKKLLKKSPVYIQYRYANTQFVMEMLMITCNIHL